MNHAVYDQIALELARLSATRILESPSRLEKAMARLHRWKAKNTGPAGKQASFTEWEEIIRTRAPVEIAALLVDEGPEGCRLRTSMPFIQPPFFTEQERIEIIARAFQS